MAISKTLLDELLNGVERSEDFLGDKGLIKGLKVRLMERMLEAELTKFLGYEPNGEPTSQLAGLEFGDLACCERPVWGIRAALPQSLCVWAVCRGHNQRSIRFRPVCPQLSLDSPDFAAAATNGRFRSCIAAWRWDQSG